MPDERIWAYALTHDFIIVTKDEDFRHRSLLTGAPPKCIWLQIGNCGTSAIEKLLRNAFEEVKSFAETAEAPLLLLS
jgi:predicted nuclease of predicted toxin-antitoxin system